MTRTLLLLAFGIAFVAHRSLVGTLSADGIPDHPNIVCIVADDLGYRDVSFNGGEIPTPAIDRIADEGVNLTQFYACPVCSPTRAGLMTGRWPLRMGYIDVYPTVKRIARLADAEDPSPLDGTDVLDVIRGRDNAPDRDWFSYIHQSGPTEALAVIQPPYKLVVYGPGILSPDAKSSSRVELFKIDSDPNETTDIAAEHADIVDRLIARLRKFRAWKTDGVPAYGDGRKGFVAPKDWIIPD